MVDHKSWPHLIDTDDLSKRKLQAVYRAPTAEMICYLDFSVSTTGMLAGIKVSYIFNSITQHYKSILFQSSSRYFCQTVHLVVTFGTVFRLV